MHKNIFKYLALPIFCICAMNAHSENDDFGIEIEFVPEISKPFNLSGHYNKNPRCEIEFPSEEETSKHPGFVVVRHGHTEYGRAMNIEVLLSEPDGKYDRYVLNYLNKCYMSRFGPDKVVKNKFSFGKEK